jgi:hypothetical protein
LQSVAKGTREEDTCFYSNVHFHLLQPHGAALQHSLQTPHQQLFQPPLEANLVGGNPPEVLEFQQLMMMMILEFQQLMMMMLLEFLLHVAILNNFSTTEKDHQGHQLVRHWPESLQSR